MNTNLGFALCGRRTVDFDGTLEDVVVQLVAFGEILGSNYRQRVQTDGHMQQAFGASLITSSWLVRLFNVRVMFPSVVMISVPNVRGVLPPRVEPPRSWA